MEGNGGEVASQTMKHDIMDNGFRVKGVEMTLKCIFDSEKLGSLGGNFVKVNLFIKRKNSSETSGLDGPNFWHEFEPF